LVVIVYRLGPCRDGFAKYSTPGRRAGVANLFSGSMGKFSKVSGVVELTSIY